MTVFDFKADTESVEKMLNRAMKKVGSENVDKALAEVAVMMLKENEKQWGSRWKPDVDQRGNALGVKSGELKASLTKVGAPGQIHEIENGRLRLGTDLFYARFFNFGTKHQVGRKAQRWTPSIKKAIKAFLGDRLLP